MVKKHSNLLGKTTVEEQDASDVEMDGQFWHDVFDLYFVRDKELRGRQDDDLIFFVLTDTDHCYCVLLNALDGAAFPSEKDTNDSSSNNKLPLRVDTNSMKTKNSKLTLFSGFVSYQMVRDAYDAGSSRFGSLLSIGHSSGKTDRLYMKGPGGRGEVEVAVSGVADQSKQDSGPFSPVISKKDFGLGSIVRKAASVASVAAKHAYAAAAATSTSDEEMIPLKCCLMSITLPWEHIAYDLLFKCAHGERKAPLGLPVPEVILKDGKGLLVLGRIAIGYWRRKGFCK
ncbi:hypothetical protein REPUB_Repub02eG0063500 [Reevesia pubescens]